MIVRRTLTAQKFILTDSRGRQKDELANRTGSHDGAHGGKYRHRGWDLLRNRREGRKVLAEALALCGYLGEQEGELEVGRSSGRTPIEVSDGAGALVCLLGRE